MTIFHHYWSATGINVTPFYYDTEKESRSGETFLFERIEESYDYPWADNQDITECVIDSSFSDYRIYYLDMFLYGCKNLRNIKGLNHINTYYVTSMWSMFSGCSSLASLDLSGFNTQNVTDMSLMFDNCTILETIYASELWNTAPVNYYGGYKMFYLAERLTGGMGTRYSSNHVGLEYAHIDGGKENPGYFTYKSATHDFQKGDTNSDGTVDVADITAIICYMAGQAAGIS